MFVKSVHFENYRNLKNAEFCPSQEINVICGDNAQGKTNLIECIWLLTGGRSFRGAKDRELIAFGCEQAVIQSRFYSHRREQEMELKIKGGKRSAVLNGVPKSYLSQIIGTLCAVVFSPNHLTLIKNAPEERRNFIDSTICQIKPSYAGLLSRYKKTLNERNALLKSISRNPELKETLEVWNERLVCEGAAICAERYKYLDKLTETAVKFYDGISGGKEKLSLAYKTAYGTEKEMGTDEIDSLMLDMLKKKQNDDIDCGFTTVGIHRDDIAVRIDGREAKSFASQGQQRSAVLSMKLAESEVIAESTGEKPVILLDDVLSELDAKRQDYLINRLYGLQVFITCCESEIQAQNTVFIKNGSIFRQEENGIVYSSGK